MPQRFDFESTKIGGSTAILLSTLVSGIALCHNSFVLGKSAYITAFLNALGIATEGPMPMIDGGTPATEYDLNTVHMIKKMEHQKQSSNHHHEHHNWDHLAPGA